MAEDGTSYDVGERFKVDCNTCLCTENGPTACTKAGCPGIL